MFISSIELKNFRNFEKSQFKFTDATIIIGKNTFGKTSILEAIYFLATGKSFKAEEELEVIKYDEPYADISCSIKDGEEDQDLRVFIEKRDHLSKKVLQINGLNKKMSTFAGVLESIIFVPEDFDILNGSPGIRRRYLDSILTQGNKEYSKGLRKYKKIVSHRNKLLQMIKKGKAQKKELEFWNENLLILGMYIQEQRNQYFSFLNSGISKYYYLYQSNKKTSIKYKPNLVSEERIFNHQKLEVEAGVTLIGPHRDDFEILLEGKKLKLFGSRGEQRLGILSISLSSLDYLEFFLQKRPILLLDDIFSELDNEHQKNILDLFQKQQTIVTTTDWDNKSDSLLANLSFINLDQ